MRQNRRHDYALPHEPVYADRVYRSPMAVVSGVLLLALVAWLCGDAVVRGEGAHGGPASRSRCSPSR